MKMRLVLGAARHCIVELDQCLFYVKEHVEVDLAALTIPVDVNDKGALSLPIMGDGVMLLEDGHEVLHMLFYNIFYSKVVNAKREADWASGACSEAGGKCTLSASFCI